MATLADTILGTSGLLAYWPLVNNQDVSGNARHLEAVGSPGYGSPPMTTDGHPSVLTTNAGSTLRIAQATLPKIRGVEGVFRLAGAKTLDYSTVIGLNQPLTGYSNRFILLYGPSFGGVASYQNINPPTGNTAYKSLTHTWEELSFGNHHFVVQLNAAGTQTEIYIDGVLDPAMQVPMDVFLQTAGHYLTIGTFYYNGAISAGSVNGQLSDVAIYDRRLTPEEITSRQAYLLGDPVLKVMPFTAIPANQETRAQFQPQDVVWGGSPGAVYAGPMIALKTVPDVFCKGLDQAWIRDGVQNVLQGYIESTVTINGEGVARRVLCFDQAGNLVGETMSRASDGKYRFDLLWLNRRYMLVAQDDPAFGPADYNAVAADFQLPTPYAPGEGVGLA